MTRVLIVYASRHGGSAGIADRIGETLQAEGFEVLVRSASKMPSPDSFDGCVVGAGVYMGSWVKEGTNYLARFADSLALRPVWLFSSGPLPGSSKTTSASSDPIELALGPATGPGSGGRRRIAELADKIGPRDHRVFNGMFDPSSEPRVISERIVRMFPRSEKILPAGDFRDWPAIEEWARTIAAAMRGVAAVG
jgi:menaquinone-dependent protoporphyrinogen oxidase